MAQLAADNYSAEIDAELSGEMFELSDLCRDQNYQSLISRIFGNTENVLCFELVSNILTLSVGLLNNIYLPCFA